MVLEFWGILGYTLDRVKGVSRINRVCAQFHSLDDESFVRRRPFLLVQVLAYVQLHKMIEPSDHVVVGVSGGADSVCLLLVLDALRNMVPFSMTAVHVEHGFRGKDSLADAEFVENLCEMRGIPCRVFHVNMEEKARTESLSLEEAGRKLRYACFEQVCLETGANKIAVAHHRDDQAETVLHHLFRGAGLRGMCGMAPVRKLEASGTEGTERMLSGKTNGKTVNVYIIRPLLNVSREEIEQWLKDQKISWCTDETNGEDAYTRNKLRLRVLPYVEAEIQPRAGAHVAQTAERFRQVQEYLAVQAGRAYEYCVVTAAQKEVPESSRTEEPAAQASAAPAAWMPPAGNQIRINLTAFRQQEPLMQTMVLQLALEQMGRGLKDISAVHMEKLLELCRKETGKELSLPRGIRVRREYGQLILEVLRRENRIGKACAETVTEASVGAVSIPGTYTFQGYEWTFSLGNAKKCEKIPEKTYTKWFDYDKIIQCLSIRTRQPGDYLEINREHGRKKLKDYFIDCKIPREEREQLPLLAEGSHVLWVPGLRISEAYKVTEQTKRLLKVEILRRENPLLLQWRKLCKQS